MAIMYIIITGRVTPRPVKKLEKLIPTIWIPEPKQSTLGIGVKA
jgi:hypothetical protein